MRFLRSFQQAFEAELNGALLKWQLSCIQVAIDIARAAGNAAFHLDNGQDELVQLMERDDDLLAGDHHRVGLINSAFHLNEARVILV